MGCSNCGQICHNLRTCKGKGKAVVMLFGVNLIDDKPAKQLQDQDQEQQQRCDHQKNVASSSSIGAHVQVSGNALATKTSGHKRKRDGPWTEEEHRRFLLGLKKLGRGEWAGIAKEFVLTRDSRQVASHGQKHFKRLAPPSTDMKRRHSIFDLALQRQGSAADTNLPNTTITESKTSSQVSSTSSATTAAPLKNNNSSLALHVVDQIPNLGLENNPHAQAHAHAGPIMFAPRSHNYNNPFNRQHHTKFMIKLMAHPSIYQPCDKY